MKILPLFAIITLTFISAINMPAAADNGSKRRPQEKGFWFYEPIKKKEDKLKKVKQTKIRERTPLGPLPPYKDLMNAHPADLRKIFKERLEEAVWKPTPQNVYAFMLVKDITRRKALAVTQMHSFMLLKSPELNINLSRPVGTFARDTENIAKMNSIKRTLIKQRRKFALIYFRSDTCLYCVEQDQVMKVFKLQTGWNVKEINIDKHPQLARKLNVSMTPTVLLIRNNSDDYMPVAVGATAADEMTANIYRASRLLDGTITQDQFFLYDFDKGGLLDPKGDPTANILVKQEINNDY